MALPARDVPDCAGTSFGVAALQKCPMKELIRVWVLCSHSFGSGVHPTFLQISLGVLSGISVHS